MKTSRVSVGGRGLVFAVSAVVACLIAFQAGKAAFADYRFRSPTPQDWMRAAELEPGNSEYWDRVGLYRENDPDHADPRLAIQYLQKALAQNPRSWRSWIYLAGAYELTGQQDRAHEAYEKARSVYPISAEVKWNYGNFMLRQSQFAEGFAEIHSAVETDRRLILLAITRCWRSSPDVENLLGKVLPADPDAYFQALDFLSTSRELTPALAAWDRLLALGKPLELRRSFPLFDELIQQDRAEDAKRVWRQALAASGWPNAAPPNESVIWNGGFEFKIADGGLDWRELPITGAVIELDSATFHSGSHSLRVDFNESENLDFSHVCQFVPVEPHTRYHFRAYLRTEQIKTESGLFFLITDANHTTQPQFRTDGLTGTHTWTEAQAEVATGPDTHFLLVQLRRLPSQLFDNKLGGTVWVDDVSLTPENATIGQAVR